MGGVLKSAVTAIADIRSAQYMRSSNKEITLMCGASLTMTGAL